MQQIDIIFDILAVPHIKTVQAVGPKTFIWKVNEIIAEMNLQKKKQEAFQTLVKRLKSIDAIVTDTDMVMKVMEPVAPLTLDDIPMHEDFPKHSKVGGRDHPLDAKTIKVCPKCNKWTDHMKPRFFEGDWKVTQCYRCLQLWRYISD